MKTSRVLISAACVATIGIAVAATTGRGVERPLSVREAAGLRGGAYFCCGTKPECIATETDCATPKPGENPNDPPQVRCAGRQFVDTNTPNQACIYSGNPAHTCTTSGPMVECYVKKCCYFNNQLLQCLPTSACGVVSVTVPNLCGDNCP